LSVLPPDGRVRLAAPHGMTEDNARLAIATRWSWIRRKQKLFTSQRKDASRKYANGESHYFDGQKYFSSLLTADVGAKVRIAGNGKIELLCRVAARI
jgi:predicted metal-dependent hydrolase